MTHPPVTAQEKRTGSTEQRRRLFAAAVVAVFAIDVWWARHLVLAGHDTGAQAVGVVSFLVVLVLTFAGVRAGLISILITLAGFIGTTLLTAHTESTALTSVGTRADATITHEAVSSSGRHTTFYYTLKLPDGSPIPKRLELQHKLNITRTVDVYYDPHGRLATQTVSNVKAANTKLVIAWIMLPLAGAFLVIGTVRPARNRTGRRSSRR